jgi:prefoldin subunit 5
MSEEQEDLANIEEHKAKYLEFLIDLEKTLLELEKSKQGFEEDVREYLSLLGSSSNKSTSQNTEGSILVDIGSGVYVQGIPESKDSLIVSLGYGFHAELKTTSTNKVIVHLILSVLLIR